MTSEQDAFADAPCVIAGIRAVDERDGDLVVLEIAVRGSAGSPPGERLDGHPWFLRFHKLIHRVPRPGNTMMSGPDGRITLAVPRAGLEDSIRAIRQAARDADVSYQAFLARRREQALREAAAEPAKRARLAEDQARIDAVLADGAAEGGPSLT